MLSIKLYRPFFDSVHLFARHIHRSALHFTLIDRPKNRTGKRRHLVENLTATSGSLYVFLFACVTKSVVLCFLCLGPRPPLNGAGDIMFSCRPFVRSYVRPPGRDVSAISMACIDRFSPNFCRQCILGQR